jgi:predicted nucleic acid-binding protein
LIVLDASLMIARILSEPHVGTSDDLYEMLDANQILVPSHWSTEIANALRTNIRRKRIMLEDVDGIIGFLSKLHLTSTPPIQLREIGPLTKFAEAYALTAYDAAYVQIAQEHRGQLATLDHQMRACARQLDIPLLPA